MEHQLEKYIDLCLIDQYANKNYCEAYELEVSDLPKDEVISFLDRVLDSDTTLRDLIFIHMQKMVNERMTEVEIHERTFPAPYYPVGFEYD
ncbi:hypothetical protein KW791_00145 [Candidatus Parcubacteria bacterium]|nr:hypothetical protein [Candidatus Parcubacteria bacterium]